MEIPTFILEAAGQDPAFDGIFPEQRGVSVSQTLTPSPRNPRRTVFHRGNPTGQTMSLWAFSSKPVRAPRLFTFAGLCPKGEGLAVVMPFCS